MLTQVKFLGTASTNLLLKSDATALWPRKGDDSDFSGVSASGFDVARDFIASDANISITRNPHSLCSK
jgi:hypothetical protein